jgi:hypothetical protein
VQTLEQRRQQRGVSSEQQVMKRIQDDNLKDIKLSSLSLSLSLSHTHTLSLFLYILYTLLTQSLLQLCSLWYSSASYTDTKDKDNTLVS